MVVVVGTDVVVGPAVVVSICGDFEELDGDFVVISRGIFVVLTLL